MTIPDRLNNNDRPRGLIPLRLLTPAGDLRLHIWAEDLCHLHSGKPANRGVYSFTAGRWRGVGRTSPMMRRIVAAMKIEGAKIAHRTRDLVAWMG